MDTMTVTAATERVGKLRKRLAELDVRKREAEAKLAEEHAGIRRAAVKRGELIESLTGGDASRTAHRQIDELDSAIRMGERVTEGLQKALSRIKNEMEPLTAELNGLQQAIETEKRAETLRVFQSKMEHAAKLASDTLANGRERLADLNRLAAQGIEAYGDAALKICGPIVETFVLSESNLDARGWKPSHPSYTRLEFWIRPMVRG
jgi:DNA repair exonuclease SbcCD ATPase subunit